SAHALMLDRPYLGQKTYDLLRVVNWLTSLGHREVHLAAKGWGALAAAFAAVLAPAVRQVTLKQGLTAYADVVESEDYRWPLAAFVPGILPKLDLPDCYRELAKSKKLIQLEPQGALAEFR